MLLAEDAPVYRHLVETLGQSASYGVPFSSDGGVLQRDLGMECVLFGPGSIDVAHRPEEYVPAEDLVRAQGTLDVVMERMGVR
jgi:acetylornithine deacetylase